MINDTIINYYVLRRNTSVATGFIFSGLHADGIVAHVERAMTDHYVLTTLYIHAVAVLAVPRVTDVEVVRSMGYPKFDEEAKRVISEMPKWVWKHDPGEFAPVRFTVPVDFKLK